MYPQNVSAYLYHCMLSNHLSLVKNTDVFFIDNGKYDL